MNPLNSIKPHTHPEGFRGATAAATLKKPRPSPTLRSRYIRLAKEIPLPDSVFIVLYNRSFPYPALRPQARRTSEVPPVRKPYGKSLWTLIRKKGMAAHQFAL